MATNDIWFFRPHPRPNAPRRLFCFAHAGGGGSTFRAWPAGLAGDIDLWAVRLPGRESRLRERPFTTWAPLLDAVLSALGPHLDRPFAFFGHSLGALVAYELAQRLAGGHPRQPERLFVSSHRAPHLPFRRQPIHRLPATEFKAALADLNGIPAPVLADDEIMNLLLPALRADMGLAELYRPAPRPPLAPPVCASHGRDDHSVNEAEMAAWGEHTTGPFNLTVHDGDHFYWQLSPQPLLALISQPWESASR